MFNADLLLKLAPALFVLLWSTGWIAARAAAPYADPLTFLVLRFGLAAVVLLISARMIGSRWPRGRTQATHALLSGMLLHAGYLGSVWWAVKHGLSAGVSGLIAAMQPILTALLAPWLADERLGRWQWCGIGVGFAGIALVLGPKLWAGAVGLDGLALPIAINVLGMVSVTLGTFYQKRFLARADLVTTTGLQYLGALVLIIPAALLLEDLHITWNAQIVATLLWSVFAVSIGAIGLYLMLINKGAVSRAASLIYLVPPVIAVEAYGLFGEQLLAYQLAGMALAVVGVALVARR